MLKEGYFPDKELRDLPGFMENIVGLFNAAFTKLQTGPKAFKILDNLAARPDMTVDEIKTLKTL